MALRREEGQAVVEYIIMLSIVVMMFMALLRGLGSMDLMGKLMKPLKEDFKYAYQYGHPKARGFDEGDPEYHPRIQGGKNNFRIFISPQLSKK